MGLKPRPKRKPEDYEHKLIHGSGLTACKLRDPWIAHQFDAKLYPLPPSTRRDICAWDEWTRVHCPGCLKLREGKQVHLVADPNKHNYEEHPTVGRWSVRVAACGAEIDDDASRIATTISYGGVTCIDCLATLPKHHREHKQKEGAPDGSKATVCGAKPSTQCPWPAKLWERVTCVDCLHIHRREPVADYIEQSAYMVMHNALSWARKQGLEVRGGACSYCNGVSDGSVCVVCAPIVHRDLYPPKGNVDDVCAELLGVPHPWLLDFVSGFDKDARPDTYPEAHKLGAKLARRYKVGK